LDWWFEKKSLLPDNNERITIRDGNVGNDKVLVLTILKDNRSWGKNRTLQSHLKVLESISYPKNLTSIGLLVSNQDEFKIMEEYLLREEFEQRGYRSVTLINKDFPIDIGRSIQERHDLRIQRMRRSLLARARNALLTHALRDENYVLWVDADIIKMQHSNMLKKMIESNKDIITPRCKFGILEDYDGNAWAGPRKKPTKAERKSIESGGLFVPDQVQGATKHMGDFMNTKEEFVQLDSVGGTVLFVKADVHRQGVFFPTEYIIGTEWEHFGYDGIETEGLCYLAKSIGATCWGMPHMVVEHDFS